MKATGSPILNAYRNYGMPRITADKPGNVVWGWAWAVSSESKNKEEAWKLIRFIEADPQGQAVASGIWQPLPGIEKGWGAKQVPNADGVAAASEGAEPIFVTPKYAEIARVLRGYIEEMAFEGADVQSSLDTAAAEINDILSD